MIVNNNLIPSPGFKHTIPVWYFICSVLAFGVPGCRQAQKTDKLIFRYNETTGIATLDPASAKNQSVMWPVHQLYNTLVEIDSGLNIVPSVAKSWEISADRLVYTFHLRKGIFFHDNEVFPGGRGRELTAGDVVYSLGRIIDTKTASSGAWIFHNRVDSVHPFTVVNDSTVVLKLLRPFHPIMGILSMQYCSIVPSDVVEKWR